MVNTTQTFHQIGWPGGMMTLRCAGVPPITREGHSRIESTMRQFSADCQMMLVWFSAVLGSQPAMRSHLAEIAKRDERFTINSYGPNGRPDAVLASVPVEDAVAAFQEAGRFERLYARAFVVFVYQTWEHAVRPAMAEALQVTDVNDVRSDLMGELRCLRNWLIHPVADSDAEAEFFNKAPQLREALKMRRGDPSLTAPKVAVLMQLLNDMQVDVTSGGAEFGVETVPVGVDMLVAIARDLQPDNSLLLPMVHMRPYAGGWIVFGDGPTATFHERDCDRANEEYQQLDGGRMMQVPSRQSGEEVLVELEKRVQRCALCSPEEVGP